MVYCHHDGYPYYMGKMLKKFYMDEKILKQLVRCGDMSSIRETIDCCDFYRRDWGRPYNV